MVTLLSYISPLEVNVSLLTIKYGYSARIDENMFLEVHEHFGLCCWITSACKFKHVSMLQVNSVDIEHIIREDVVKEFKS